MGEGPARRPRSADRARGAREPAPRCRRAAARREGWQADGPAAARRQGRRRPPDAHARSVGTRSEPDRPLHRSADVARHPAGVRRRRPDLHARRRAVLGLSSGRRRADRLQGHAKDRRPVGRAHGERRQDQRAGGSRAVQTSPFLSVRLLLSCGEASGDLYAGALTRELLAIDPALSIAGFGGPQFAAAGGRLVDDYRDLAVTGLTEAIVKLPRSLAARRALVADAERSRPDALVLIDFPDFNFRLAPPIKRLGVPVIYYISPQIWAWRPKRLATVRSIADCVLVIFPFEESIYREGHVPVEFVGHPLVELAKPSAGREVFLAARGLVPSAPTVAMLPGSRPNEVEIGRASCRERV